MVVGSPFATGAAEGYIVLLGIDDVDRAFDGLLGYRSTAALASTSFLFTRTVPQRRPSKRRSLRPHLCLREQLPHFHIVLQQQRKSM